MNKRILCFVMTFGLIAATFVIIGSEEVSAYTNSNPIRIDSDDDWSNYGKQISGSGGILDPWIIDDLQIDGSSDGYCIYIGNTTDYFQIKENKLHNASGENSNPWAFDTGVTLYNVTNGKIYNNFIVDCAKNGIYMRDCDSQFNYNKAWYNRLLNNDNGVYLWSSDYQKIQTNSIYDSDVRGIYLYDTDYGNVTNNYINDSESFGIFIQDSDYADISFNNISSSYQNGLMIYSGSTGNVIRYNEFADTSTDYAIEIYNLQTGNYVDHNNFYNNAGLNSQANDVGVGYQNNWDLGTSSSGNYWNDNSSGYYSIDGTSSSKDNYPVYSKISGIGPDW